jgi:sugar O-acyltransferase (sialic acid O-acetyltransferase NeuD family)
MSDKQRVFVVGAGGLGREVFHAFQDCRKAGDFPDCEIAGFIDDNPQALEGYSKYPPVVCGVREYEPRSEDTLLCAIGIPLIRKKVVTILRQRDVNFATLVHPTATVRRTSRLGEGVILAQQAFVSTEVDIGEFVLLNGPITVGHDSTIGDFGELAPKAAVSGNCHIEEGVFLATGSSVAPGCRVGEWSRVSMNTAVMRNVRPFSLVHGVPGRAIRDYYRDCN